jgi:PAS domain S-box-containing protein
MENSIKIWLEQGKNVSTVLLDSIYDGVYIVNPRREVIFWNRGAEEITGHLKSDVTGHWCGDNILNHLDENGVLLCRGACPILSAMAGGKPIEMKVYPKHKDGHRFPVETHVSVIRDENDTIIGAIEVFRDITHQEDYRILQEKFNLLIKRYVSTTTFDEIQQRIRNETDLNIPRILDMSILYLDIVNFTGFTENSNPQDVVEMLNDLFGVCEVITRENLGDIDKFIGDALMAVFADANDAVRAAGKILNHGLLIMNEIRKKQGLTEIGIRIGINSGPVLQGDIGALDRKDLTVIGDTVNVASRVEKQAPCNRLLISDATLSRLDAQEYGRFSEFGLIPVKGKADPLKLFILNTD